jgi:hypothetical protein
VSHANVGYAAAIPDRDEAVDSPDGLSYSSAGAETC